MTYNTTAIENTENAIEFMQEANSLTNGALGSGISLLICLILFGLILEYQNDYRKALLGSGSVSLFIGIILMAIGLIHIYLLVFYLAITTIGLILLRDRDKSD